MIPGMNPKAIEQAMKKMGIKQVDVPASEVIIKSDGKDIVIANPKVVKVNMMGQDSFQVTGDVEERAAAVEISEDDVKTVAEQAGVSEEKAREALRNSNGDLAAVIMELKK
ncbi:nascent polypeptide-associated complex protein [Candidatus Woesearchaeota archaeon]|nr:nascent polypeptide-associated complex protein [Candidatus Woesearchaeota archaeon]